MMVEMSHLSGASMTPCGWVGPVVGGENLNSISQHTIGCGPCKGVVYVMLLGAYLSKCLWESLHSSLFEPLTLLGIVVLLTILACPAMK